MLNTLTTRFASICFVLSLAPCLAQKPCGNGWFGSRCQYLCHCEDVCLPDGTCTGLCNKGWFGPQCQYEDVTADATLRPDVDERLFDGNDGTCNTNLDSRDVSLLWNSPNPVTWIRIDVDEPEKLFLVQNLTITISQREIIEHRKFVIIGQRTMDIHFARVLTTDLDLYGEAVPHICSVYVTGGRNVAIKQSVVQSSNYTDTVCDQTCSYAENAVDGRRQQNLYDKSCTHTNVEELPWWKLTFNRPCYVNKYVLYNRDAYLDRLSQFRLRVTSSDGQLTLYDDATRPQMVYRVVSIDVTESVRSVQIWAKHLLTLCEVEMYGDTDCPQGFYGRDCEFMCNCRDPNESCLVSTGGCESGCDDGFFGPGCLKTCAPTYYGKDCQERCSDQCKDQLCNNTNGHCLECPVGRIGVMCEEGCPHGRFGKGCSEKCSRSCSGGTCSSVTGTCSHGCLVGYLGDKCNDYCDSSKYGSDCQLTCSQYCQDSSNLTAVCHHSNGVCLNGCLPGYDGLQCNHECVPTYFGEHCRQRCSSDCLNNLCHHIDGRCLACPPGKSGNLCQFGECSETYYGSHCEYRCSPHCLDQVCNVTTGACIDCPVGRAGEWCLEDCPATFYGQGCQHRCIHGCLNQLCNSVTGHCVDCPQGKNGRHCELDSAAPHKEDHVEIIVGGVVAGALLVVLVVIGMVYWRKRVSQLLRWTKMNFNRDVNFKYARRQESSDPEVDGSLFEEGQP